MSQMTVPQMPKQQNNAAAPTEPDPNAQAQQAAQQAPQAFDVDTFDDLPPDPTQNEGEQPLVGDAEEAPDPSYLDFEALLSAPPAPTAPAPATPEPQTPPQGVPPAQTAPQAPQQPQGQQPPGQQAPQAAQPQQAPAQAPGTQQAQPGQQPQQPQAQAPQPQSQVDQTQVLSNLRQQIDQNRAQLVDAVAQHYEAQITDDDVDLLNTDPKKALAKMAGRVHADGLSNILEVMSQNLPGMVYALMETQRAQQEAADAFYHKYTHFNRATHGQSINQIAQTVRQLNPQLDKESFMTLVATMAAQHLGLQPVAAAAPQQQQVSPQQQQQQPRTPRGFAPAGASQTSTPQKGNGQVNPWAAAAEAAMLD